MGVGQACIDGWARHRSGSIAEMQMDYIISLTVNRGVLERKILSGRGKRGEGEEGWRKTDMTLQLISFDTKCLAQVGSDILITSNFAICIPNGSKSISKTIPIISFRLCRVPSKLQEESMIFCS